MSMKPGRDDLAGRVDLGRRLRHRADGDDAPVADADVGGTALGARAVDDDAVADREVDAHRSARSSRVASSSTPRVGEDDAVPLAGGRDGDLAVEHVLEHGGRVALVAGRRSRHRRPRRG